jgi:hypothetical protein
MSRLVGRMGGAESKPASEPGQWREEFLEELSSAWHARREGEEAPDPATAAGMWSALAGPADAEAAAEVPEEPGGKGQQKPSPDDPETVIDLTTRATKRG